MAEADIGYGTLLKCGVDMVANTATVTVAGLKDLTPPSYSRGAVDRTSFDSPNRTKQFNPGLVEVGDLSFDLFWQPGDATDDVLRACETEQGTRFWEISWPQVATPVPTASFRAFLTGRTPAVPMEENMTCTVTFKVDGAITWANV